MFVVQINWYAPIIKYLQKGYFEIEILKEERSHIVIKSRPYSLYEGKIYKPRLDNILWHCLTFEKTIKILVNFYEGPTRGHFDINTIVKKVLAFGYW